MTLQEAKEQIVELLKECYESAHTRGQGGFHVYESFSELLPDLNTDETIKYVFESCAQEAREKAIDKCMESIEHYWKHNPGFTYEGIQFTLKNLKEKSICNHDKEPVTGSDGCEECPDCGKYGEDC